MKGRVCFRAMSAGLLVAIFCVAGYAEGIGVKKTNATTPGAVEFNKGVDSFTAGDLVAAEAAFKKSLQLDPGMVGALLGLAEVASQRRKPDEVGSYLQRALALGPQFPEVHHAYGRYLFSAKKDYKGAEASLQKAIMLNSQSVGPFLDLADLYMIGFNDPGKAVEAYQKALALEPTNAGAHYGLGNAQARLSRFDAAETEFRKASELEPKNPLPYLGLGRLYAARNQGEKAIASYDSVLKIEPKSLEALIEKGDVLFSMGRKPQALQSYKTALGYAPSSPLVQLKIGMVEQSQGHTAEAQAAYAAVIKLDPKQSIAYNNLAWMAAERKVQLADALTWAQKAVSLDPKVGAYHGTLGWVYRARGENAKALASLEQAATLAPNQPAVLYRLGMIYSEQGMRDKAVSTLRKAVASNTKFDELDEAKKLLASLETTR